MSYAKKDDVRIKMGLASLTALQAERIEWFLEYTTQAINDYIGDITQ